MGFIYAWAAFFIVCVTVVVVAPTRFGRLMVELAVMALLRLAGYRAMIWGITLQMPEGSKLEVPHDAFVRDVVVECEKS